MCLHASYAHYHSVFFQCYGDHRDLHSFPTRRSSDLPRFTPRFRSQSPNLMAPSPSFLFTFCPSRLKHSARSEEHTSELQSHHDLVCRLLLEKKNTEQDSDYFMQRYDDAFSSFVGQPS